MRYFVLSLLSGMRSQRCFVEVDQILRRERGQRNIHFPCSTRLIHTLAICVTVHISFNAANCPTPIRYSLNLNFPDGLFIRVCVCVLHINLTDRASTIPSNILRGCQQSGTWSAERQKERNKRFCICSL